MTVVQTITTPNGDEMVIVPKAEWERLLDLLEDAEDSAHHERFMKDVRADAEDLVPLVLVKRLGAGENPLRVWREHRGYEAGTLAAAAGVPLETIAAIEAGHVDPPVGVLKALAAALKVEIEDLIPR